MKGAEFDDGTSKLPKRASYKKVNEEGGQAERCFNDVWRTTQKRITDTNYIYNNLQY